MSMSADLTLVEGALDALEQREAKVLVWGLVDAALNIEEVFELLNSVFESEKYRNITSQSDCTIFDSGQLLQKLRELGLIFEVPSRRLDTTQRWRTRMAEGLRLLSRLRQLMPRHRNSDGWNSAPTLVADYRLLWRPRRYPKRNLNVSVATEALENEVHSDDTLQSIRHWLGKSSSTWQLSRFQLEAAVRVLASLEKQRITGTLVSAGTGSGKTLAFYLPALSWLASQKMSSPNSSGVRILAIYPRNELLKDQLSEVYSQSRKFDDLLGPRGGKAISLGVLYGDTPNNLNQTQFKWTGGVCSFFKCPQPRCDGDMHVADDDLKTKNERLTCIRCGNVVESSKLRITRDSLQINPPDILFTSVEMLNQRMSDSGMRHLFGLGPLAQFSPSLVLLDEVHVYSGTYGAQVAHLLRRWSKLSKHASSFVGLSATISEGERFFASLVGLDQSVVKEVTPRPEDMESEGAEYMVALRGDPVSQAALLSTSIQTLMLGSRLLDTQNNFDAQLRPFAGWRAFAFTDQMDATNRLYSDLLDAEGRNHQGKSSIKRYPNGGLAHLRQPDPNRHSRYEAGQDWRLPVQIGHSLTTRHRVGRTTAYDSGVALDTEIVVATAALEVGYDDEAVGLVLQHKAPRDMAQFLQRKGRAGRTRHMRPWTIMVLSDYGRDRLAYQAYEQFFDPELPPRDLPLSNRYVQRMQAVYALVDFLGVHLQIGYPRGSVWQDLSGPPEIHEGLTPNMNRELKKIVDMHTFPLSENEFKRLQSDIYQVVKILNSGQATTSARRRVAFHIRRQQLGSILHLLVTKRELHEEFAQYLMSALGLPRQSIDSLLWEHPRPVLLEVAPTALRRLERNWMANGQPNSDYRSGHPLPEFVPATLFSDLSLPEVRIQRPNGEREVYLPVQQALSELAPGKVSKRFDQPLWLGVEEKILEDIVTAGESDPVLKVEITDWYDVETHQLFQALIDGQVVSLVALRPRVLSLNLLPDSGNSNFPMVSATSNARLEWKSQVFARRIGYELKPPHGKVGIVDLIDMVNIHTHAGQSPALVRRYAVGSHANLRIGGRIAAKAGTGEKTIDQRVHFQFLHSGNSCGVGFEIDVDAMCFKLNLPQHPHIDIDFKDPLILRALRTSKFYWEARYGTVLGAIESNVFLRQWIAEIFLTSVIQRCAINGDDLQAALKWVSASPTNLNLESILETLFQAPNLSSSTFEDDDNESEIEFSSIQPPHVNEPDKLRKKIRDTLSRQDVLSSLFEIGACLYADIDASWDEWLLKLMKQTLAAALLEAIQRICPQVDSDDLSVDISSGPSEEGKYESINCIWITEVNPGGNGLIEQVSDAIASNSAEFYRLVETALGASEFELIDQQLRNFIDRIAGNNSNIELQQRTFGVRMADSSKEAQILMGDLRHELVKIGHSVFHGYISALANRLLRPSTPVELDQILVELMNEWDRLEQKLEVEVESRVICALFSQNPQIDLAFARAGMDLPPDSQRQVWRFGLLMGIVWARGQALRANGLPLNSRFELIPAVTERLVLKQWISKPQVPILVTASDWINKVHERLKSFGKASVQLEYDKSKMSEVIQALTTLPIQMDYLNVYPRLVAVSRRIDSIELSVELLETL
jgi:hypothetical protein